MMEGEEEPFEISIEKIIEQIDAIDWSDIEHCAQSTIPQNPFITTLPSQYRKYYQLFRAVITKEELSARSFALTTLILRLKSTNYYALMLRSKYFFSKLHTLPDIEQQIFFANCLLSLNAKEYQIWTYKKQILKTYPQASSSVGLYHTETEFLDYLLDQDTKNYHVWDYKLWLTLCFHQQEQQIEYTAAVLFKGNKSVQELRQQFEGMGMDVKEIDWRYCYSFWSYRFNLRLAACKHKDKEEIGVFQQIEVMREWLNKEQNQNNECGWNYLIGLVLEGVSSTKSLLQQFMQISLDIFSKNKNRFAGAAVIQFADELEQKYGQRVKQKPETILALKESDKVRQLYYEYLLQL